MRTILVLLSKDFANFFTNKAAVSLTFIVPFAMIYVFGQVFGVNRTDRGPSGIPLAVVNASENAAAIQLVNALKAEKAFKVVTEFLSPDQPVRPLTETDLRPMMRDSAFRFAVVLPPDFLSDAAFGLHLKVYSNPRNEIETQLVNGILQKTIFSSVPQLLGQSLQAQGRKQVGDLQMDSFNHAIAAQVAKTFGGDADVVLANLKNGDFASDPEAPADSSDRSEATKDILSRLLRVETVPITEHEVKAPAATRIVSGFAIQFLLFALSSSAAALFYERDRGIFHRILAGPVSRSQILWSKFLYGTTLGVLQLVVLFVGGRVLYGIDIEHHLGYLALVSVVVAATCTAFGMLLASLASSVEAASGLATFVILLMCSVGGAWFPISLMPETIQQLSRLTIVYWSMESFEQVFWLDASFIELAPTLGVLVSTTAVIMAIATWRFNRGKLFE